MDVISCNETNAHGLHASGFSDFSHLTQQKCFTFFFFSDLAYIDLLGYFCLLIFPSLLVHQGLRAKLWLSFSPVGFQRA